jgi:hypothetical protein
MNPAPIKPLISTSDLDKIDVRVGTILAVEDVAHSENARTAACRFRRPRALHSRRHEKERPSPKPDGPFATQTATRAILFSLAIRSQSRSDGRAIELPAGASCARCRGQG